MYTVAFYARRVEHAFLATVLVAILSVIFLPIAANAASINKAPPPSKFKPVSKLFGLPGFLPGLGTLYVDPATAPAGPFLGYDHKGRLVDAVFMVPISDIDAHKDFHDVGGVLKGQKVDHVDILFNPGHAGLPDPHYHIILWFISKNEQKNRMK